MFHGKHPRQSAAVDGEETMVDKSEQEIVDKVMKSWPTRNASRTIATTMLVNAIRQAREGWVRRPSVVIMLSDTFESDGVEVIDAGWIFENPKEFAQEDMEGLVANLEEHDWPEIAADVREVWENGQ